MVTGGMTGGWVTAGVGAAVASGAVTPVRFSCVAGATLVVGGGAAVVVGGAAVVVGGFVVVGGCVVVGGAVVVVGGWVVVVVVGGVVVVVVLVVVVVVVGVVVVVVEDVDSVVDGTVVLGVMVVTVGTPLSPVMVTVSGVGVSLGDSPGLVTRVVVVVGVLSLEVRLIARPPTEIAATAAAMPKSKGGRRYHGVGSSAIAVREFVWSNCNCGRAPDGDAGGSSTQPAEGPGSNV